MPLVADGPGGQLDATLPDLGVGAAWQSIHHVRPRVRLTCPACGTSMHAKVSPRGLRFFAHDSACRECPLTGETIEHRLLKSALASAIRLAGWHAQLEAAAPDHSWRADVLATSPDGARRMAWEAQLAHQIDEDTEARTARYVRDDIGVVWVFDRPIRQPLPMITVEVSENGIEVSGPIIRLDVRTCDAGTKCVRYRDLPHPPPCVTHGRWEPVSLPLERFVALVCQDAVRWGPVPTPTSASTTHLAGNGGEHAWTSPVYLRRATAIRQAQEAIDAAVADERARLWEQQLREMRRQQAEAERHEANRAALRERQQQLTPIVLREVATRTEGQTWELPGDPDCAMGVSIIARGERTAVICPVASRITNEVAELLIDLTVYVASDHERRAIARRCRPGQRIVVLARNDA